MGEKRSPGGSTVSVARRRSGWPFLAPNNLIHRNNSPESISMRVSGRFDLPGGVTLEEAEMVIAHRLKLPRLLAGLIVRRRVYETT